MIATFSTLVRPMPRVVLLVCCTLALVTAPRAGAQAPLQVTTLTETLDGGVGGVAVDALGFVYVADFGEKVWKVSPFGELEILTDSVYGASGNAIDSRGNLLQSSFHGNSVHRIARDGAMSTVATGLEGPVGIVLDGDDNAYVCNCRGNSISRITPEGTVSEIAASELFNCPNGITRDDEGNLYVVNFSDGRMIRVSPEGDAREHAVIPGGGNGHVARVGPDFFVTGFRSNQLYRVDAEGQVTTVRGTGAFAATDGPAPEAAFASPNGITYDPRRDVLYINDFLTPFTQRLQSPPQSTVRRVAFPTLTQTLVAAMEQGGIEATETAYRAYRHSKPGRFTEIELNIFGYTLLQQGNTPAAIRIFELNTEDYPKSFNTWDSLAEAHKVAGHRQEAIRFYEESLEIEPSNGNAVEMLKQLGVDP